MRRSREGGRNKEEELKLKGEGSLREAETRRGLSTRPKLEEGSRLKGRGTKLERKPKGNARIRRKEPRAIES